MFETIAIPMWVVWLAGLLALAGLLDRILMPSVRWVLRRRFYKAVDRLNEKLQLKIQPFKFIEHGVMVERLASDPVVMQAVLDYSKEDNVPHRIAADEAWKYAREIVPSFSAIAYFGFGIRMSRWLSKKLFRVRLGYVDEAALKNLDDHDTVIFVMNHRSNMDYVLVTYLAASRSALSYAVGEWARVWPLKQLIRSMGAYFIRRKSRNQLYRRVLARYVQLATQGGVTQAIFPEGGLTRDGLLKPAKLGLLNYIVSDFNADAERDVVFVPVGVNYDRVLEDRVLLASSKKEKAGFLLKIWGVMFFVARHLWRRMFGKFKRFGYASVSFGTPVSLRAFLHDHGGRNSEKTTAALGQHLMNKVGDVVPVLPVPLVATVFLDEGGNALTLEQVQERSMAMLDRLLARGATIYIPKKNRLSAVEIGLRILTLRGAVELQDGIYRIKPEHEKLVRYYANSIAHLRNDAPVPKVNNADLTFSAK